MAVALVLPESGRLVACDRDLECLEVAKRYYELAGVSHKVNIPSFVYYGTHYLFYQEILNSGLNLLRNIVCLCTTFI